MENTLNRFNYLAIIGITLFFQAGISLEIRANPGAEIEFLALQQQVTGVVTDENGLPIPGVAVRIKNSSTGTVTNPDGIYTINAASDDYLIFTYLGFQSMKVPVDSRTEINIRLEEDVTALGEVEINAGYYYTTRREATGNISRVTAEEIELQPVISPIQALEGRMAGVEIVPASGGNPGGANTIRIRGTNSLREDGNLPLYIVDGMPIDSSPIESTSLASGIDPLNNLNLSSIESIEVLKDADATAIYGSRGANGVVLITTKKGRPGKVNLEARVNLGSSRAPNKLKLLNTEQYLQVRRQAFENDGIEPTERNAYDLLLWDKNHYTDWQDFFRGGTAETTNANLSLIGGSESTVFRVGSSYSSQGTIYPGKYDYQKATGEANVFHTSHDSRFRMNFSSSYSVDRNNLLQFGTFSGSSIFLPPNAPPLFNQEGELNWQDWQAAGINHPLAGYHNNSTTKSQNLIVNSVLEYEVLKGLILKSNLGYTLYGSEAFMKRPKRSNPVNQPTHASSHAITDRYSWLIEPQMMYNITFNNFQLESIVGGTIQQNKTDRLGIQGTGYASEALIGNLAAADQIIHPYKSNTVYNYSALFARLGMNWNKKYFINLTGRRDGSSRFGPDKRFANFGAIGASWIFSEESFVAKIFPFLSFGKLRGSYGTTGNDQIGDYGYLDTYEPTLGPGGLHPSGLANPGYSWEVNKKLEAAVELGLFDDDLNFSVSWYRNRSSNQLVGYPLPDITGFPLVQANLPATVQNSGLELEGSSRNINRNNLQWTTSFNISFPNNELIEYPDIEQSPYATVYRVGSPLDISLLYNYDELDPETQLYTVKDVNDDGRLDYQDQTYIHDNTRDIFMGINNNLNYQNFAVSFLFEYVNQEGIYLPDDAGSITNYSNDVLDRLSDGGSYQKISQSSQAAYSYYLMSVSNFAITDASFLRLKTLSLSYSLSQEVLESLGIGAFKIFFTGQNLFTFTKYKGMDPSIPQSRHSFRNLKTITGGIQIKI